MEYLQNDSFVDSKFGNDMAQEQVSVIPTKQRFLCTECVNLSFIVFDEKNRQNHGKIHRNQSLPGGWIYTVFRQETWPRVGHKLTQLRPLLLLISGIVNMSGSLIDQKTRKL